MLSVACGTSPEGNGGTPLQKPNLSLGARTYTYGQAVNVDISNSGGGKITECSSDPESLPEGLALSKKDDESTCVISGSPTRVPLPLGTASEYTIKAVNETGEGTATVSITVNPTHKASIPVGASVGAETHPPIPPPDGYVLGVFLGERTKTTSGTTMTLAYDDSTVHGFDVTCDIASGSRPIFTLKFNSIAISTSAPFRNSDPHFTITGASTARGRRFDMSYTNDLIFRSSLTDPNSDLHPISSDNTIILVCDDGAGNTLRVSNAIRGQYFSSATQTSPAGMGYRFHNADTITPESGNTNSVFSLNRRTGQLTAAKTVGADPSGYALYLTGSDNNKYAVGVEVLIPTEAPQLVNHADQAFSQNDAINIQFTNNGGGALISCGVSPSLPASLSVSVTRDHSSCQITGTLTTSTHHVPGNVHTVTATNKVGGVSTMSTATVRIDTN